MNKIKLLGLSLFLLAGCTIDNGHFEAVSTRPLSLFTMTANNGIIAKDIERASEQHIVAVIPLSKAPNISDAINQILDEHKADYLADVDIKFQTFRILPWYGYSSWKIEGDAVRVYK